MFGQNSIFVRIVEKVADVFWLNMLWLICSLPIFTIGASTTALYYVTLKMVNNEEAYIVKSFLKAFRQNFVKATIVWVPSAILGIGIYLGIWRFHSQPDMSYKAASVMLFFMGMVLCMLLAYIFPILARFENGLSNSVRNAVLISIVKLPKTIVILIIMAFPYIMIYTFPYMIIFVLLFGGSGTAYVISMLMVRIFNSLNEK